MVFASIEWSNTVQVTFFKYDDVNKTQWTQIDAMFSLDIIWTVEDFRESDMILFYGTFIV